MLTLRIRAVLILGFISFLLIYTLRNSISALSFKRLPTIGTPSTAEPLTPAEVPPKSNSPSTPENPAEPAPNPPPSSEPASAAEEPKPKEHVIPDHPTYKPEPPPSIPIIDNFPLAASAQSAAELPPIPPWNRPPKTHVPERTPLFIGFTRNWNLLQQTIVSWVTAGWPPEDIYVFENTGTMRSNELGLLTLQNPFYLNHTRLHMFGVNVIICPTLFSFSQLQNFFLWTAIQNNYTTYFWGHMDVIALSFEDRFLKAHPEVTLNNTADPTFQFPGYQSIYSLAVDALRLATSPEPDPNASYPDKPWAVRFFAYDRLALVNRAAFESIGGWDTAIPYYHTDCDMHDRLKLYGFEYNDPEDVEAGIVQDVANSLDDLLVLYRKKETVEAAFTIDKPPPDSEVKEEPVRVASPSASSFLGRSATDWISDIPGSPSYKNLLNVTEEMSKFKNANGGGGRNTWQSRQGGGKGEPYYRDPAGFDKGLQMATEMGRAVYAEKWGHQDCGLMQWGRKAGDEWRVEHDWE